MTKLHIMKTRMNNEVRFVEIMLNSRQFKIVNIVLFHRIIVNMLD